MRSNISDINEDQIAFTEHTSDDEIIKNSQNDSKLKLKTTIEKNLFKKCKTFLSISQKDILFDSSEGLNINDIYNIDNDIIKNEQPEMYKSVGESIEMRHDLNGILLNTQLSSNVLEYSSRIICNSTIEQTVKKEKQESDLQMQDPLYINDRYKDRSKKMLKMRKLKRTIFGDKLNSQISKTVTQKNVVNDVNEKKNISILHHNTCSNRINRKIKKKHSQFKQKKKRLFSKELVQKLKSLIIQLQHEVPPQHKIEKDTGSKPLNKEQLMEFETYGPLKRGPYTKSENKIIQQNWKFFCDIHNWNEKDTKPFLNSRHNGKYYLNLKERKKFVQFLANGLPWRSLFSVYYKFKNLINVDTFNGKFTPAQDKIITKYMIEKSNSSLKKSSSEVATILNRKTSSILYRFQKLNKNYNLNDTFESINNEYQETKNFKSNKKSLKNIAYKKVLTKVTWTYSIVTKFINALIELSSYNLSKLKNKIIDQSVWNKIEKIIRIDHKILQNFWYFQLHMQIFCPMPIYLNDLKIKLIQCIYKKKIKVLENIIWENVCLNFIGLTPFFLSKLFNQLVQIAQLKVESLKIKNIIEYLYHEYIHELKEKSTDFILPKLYYKRNKIIYVDRGTEKKIANKTTTDPFKYENIQ